MRRVAIALVLLLVASCQAPPQMAQRPTALQQFVLFFRDGGAALTADGRAIVDRIAAAARELHPQRIEVIGANDGMAPNREKLADRRAAAVADALVKAGVDPRIITRAGIEQPAGAGVAAHDVLVRFSPNAG
ncbi:MAG TPA: OmpA family protein [Stellaceae bacterium]|jgi:outer membrane protein OmpA-like peptidoglycan-associated protein|nr:OmpA family protein [Stellaceae bacterium]